MWALLWPRQQLAPDDEGDEGGGSSRLAWRQDHARRAYGLPAPAATEEEYDALDFDGVYALADTATCLDYEGYPVHATYFSNQQWEMSHEFQKVMLSHRESEITRTLEMSRMMRKPLGVMTAKVA